jgi:hypothetical protein
MPTTSMIGALVAAAALSLPAHANVQYVTGTNLCAGLGECSGPIDDNNFESCSMVIFARCEGAGTTVDNSHKIATSVAGMAMVAKDAYQACEATEYAKTNGGNLAQCAASLAVMDPDTGYRDFNGEVTPDSSNTNLKYAFMQAGVLFGSSAMGMYVGIANYVNIGSETITANTNRFYVSSYGSGSSAPGVVDRSASSSGLSQGSDLGAPDGPYDVCVSPLPGTGTVTTSSGECGPDVSYPPDATKFSIFGIAEGDWTGNDYTAGGWASKDSFGLRQIITVPTGAVVTFNGGTSLASIGTTNVQSMRMVFTDGTQIVYTFPQRFNYGNAASWTPPSAGSDGTIAGPPILGSKDVAGIRAGEEYNAPGAANFNFHVDYLFPLDSDFKTTGAFFVYDPTVKTEGASTSGATSASLGTATAATLLCALALFGGKSWN